MNSFCAFALPEISFANSTSLSISVTRRDRQRQDMLTTPSRNVHTISLLAFGRVSLANCARLFEIYVPIVRFALVIFQGEPKDSAAFLYGIFAFGIVGEGGSYQIKGCGGRPRICRARPSAA